MKKKNYTPTRSNFQTHKLQFSLFGIKLVPTFKSLVFYGIFAAIGILVLVIGAIQLPLRELPGLFICSAIFGGAGGYGIFRTYHKKYPEIDLSNNMFYPEGKPSHHMFSDDSGIPLNQLKRINVERTYHRGSKSSYYCYTLYLDFGELGNFPFLGHGALKLFAEDADRLSSILNMPISPEDEYKSWLSPDNKRKNSWAMLIFGTIWTLIAASFMYGIYQNDFSNNPNLHEWHMWLLTLFPAIGLLMIISAIVSLVKDKLTRIPNNHDDAR